jgi:hypothetical protein
MRQSCFEGWTKFALKLGFTPQRFAYALVKSSTHAARARIMHVSTLLRPNGGPFDRSYFRAYQPFRPTKKEITPTIPQANALTTTPRNGGKSISMTRMHMG